GVLAPLPAEIVLEGAVEPSWFQQVVDQDLADKRLAFDKEFAPEKRLPRWLLERPPVTRTPPRNLGEYPALDGARAAALRPVFAAMKKGDWQKARAAGDGASAGDLPAALREFLLGLALCGGGAPEEALPHVDQSLALQADFTWTRVMRAQCLEQLRRHPDAEQEYQRALADDPGEPKLYELAVGEMLRS